MSYVSETEQIILSSIVQIIVIYVSVTMNYSDLSAVMFYQVTEKMLVGS